MQIAFTMILATTLAGMFLVAAAPVQSKSIGRGLAQDEPFTMASSFTFPTEEFPDEPSGCTTVMTGCTGTFVMFSHDIAGEVEVIDDCTFRVTGWEFDGIGPAVEWWAAPQSTVLDPTEFPFSEGQSIKIGELGTGIPGDGPYVVGATRLPASICIASAHSIVRNPRTIAGG